MKIFILLLGATLLELYVIISVGEVIGAFYTVMLVILTAAIGSYLLKQQGRNTLSRAQQSMLQGQVPAQEMIEGLVLMVSGVLLLTPGFITDFVGLFGLMPWSRALFVQNMLANQSYRFFNQFNTNHHQPKQNQYTQQSNQIHSSDTLEGEFWEDK